MTTEMKKIFDNYSIYYGDYNKFVEIFENLSDTANLAEYEEKVLEEFHNSNSYYLCEAVAVQFYKEGKYKKLIKKMYAGVEKIRSKLTIIDNKINKGD